MQIPLLRLYIKILIKQFYPEGVVEVKTIKKNRGQPQKLIKEVK